jgi:cytochrome c oxidase subunit 4
MAERAHTSAMTYVVTWAVLVVLAAATYLLARADLGALQLPAAMAIAMAKAVLVVLIFMHLLEHGPANRIFFLVAFLFIVLLVALTTADVATRGQAELPRVGPTGVTGGSASGS